VQWESLLLRVGPILAFLVCVTIVAELADGLGVFSTLAQGAARLAQGSVLGLWLLIVGVAVTATAVLSLDTTAVLVTPVVLALARQLDLDVALFAYTAVWLANTASLFLPVSNLTNLLALSALPRHSVRDFAVLTWPAAVTSVLITVLALAVIFRRSLRGRYQSLPAQPAAHRGLLVLGMIVCGALGPALLLGVNVVAASAVAAAILVVGCAIGARSLLTWRLLPWQLVLGVGLLFILVQIAHDHGLGAALSRTAGHGSSGVAMTQLCGVGAVGANRWTTCRVTLPWSQPPMPRRYGWPPCWWVSTPDLSSRPGRASRPCSGRPAVDQPALRCLGGVSPPAVRSSYRCSSRCR
jgi:arsenical pump membrane protein